MRYRLTLALWGLFFMLSAQEATLEGRVTDSSGEPLVGATIQGVNSVLGTSSDANGHFALEIPLEPIRLLIDYLGYQNLDTTVNARTYGEVVTLAVTFQEESLTFR